MQEIEQRISAMELQLKVSKDFFQKRLVELWDLIVQNDPDHIWFLDRSGRTVMWMMQGLLESLGDTAIRVQASTYASRIVPISLHKQVEPDPTALYQFRKDRKILPGQTAVVVDGFSESYPGLRNVDFAVRVLGRMLRSGRVTPFVFVEAEFGRPQFLFFSDDQQSVLYGIRETLPHTLTSEPFRVPESLQHVAERYSKIFYRFGQSTAGDMSRNG